MQEQMNKAMSSLSETVGQDVPTLNEVRDKIEARYAKAKGHGRADRELGRGRMLEVERRSTARPRPGWPRSAPSSGSRPRPVPPRWSPDPPTPRPRPTAAPPPRGPDCPAPATAPTGAPSAREVGVGPRPRPWPDDDRLDPDLLARGDRRNVVDRYRYWRVDAIVEDLDRRRPFHVAVENWRHDLNIGTVVRNANAFGAACTSWDAAGTAGAPWSPSGTSTSTTTAIEDLVAWAATAGLPLVGVDNLPGSVPLETADLPRACVLVFGRRGPGCRPPPATPARRCARSPCSAPPGPSTPGSRPASPCTPGSAGRARPPSVRP